MADAAVPGLAVAAVAGGRVVLAKAYGWAHLERRIAARPSTLFLLASPSKLVVSMTVLALAERRMVDLDEDIGHWLPFEVRHPMHPAIPISLRMLLGHRASLADDLGATRASYVVGDSPVPLGDWLRVRLSEPKAFLPHEPGANEQYANLGFALAAHVAECAAQLPFGELARALVLRPLGMSQSTYRLRDAPQDELAAPHDADGALAHYGYPDYPVGGLRTDAIELARLLLSLVSDGQSVMSRESNAAILGGLGARQIGNYVGHDGADVGAGTRVLLDPGRGMGVLLLGNACWTYPFERRRRLAPVEDALWAAAARRATVRG